MSKNLLQATPTPLRPQPKYLVVASRFREQIHGGQLKSGDRLPTFSQVCEEFSVTLGTVERAYNLLEQEQLIERRQGSGTFVMDRKKLLTGNIGFIGNAIINEHESPFNTNLMKGVRQAAESLHQHLLYLGSDHNLNVQALKKIDGLLVSNIENLSNITFNLPCISLLHTNEGMTNIVADDFQGGIMAVKHLVSLGHRRIACLFEENKLLPRRRFMGYCEGLLRVGIEPDLDWARLTKSINNSLKVNPYLEWGRRQTQSWLQENWSELGCTALLVQNEMAAIGAMQVFQEEGWKIPQDVSIMGFDGTELCDFAAPRLTAVELPLKQIGIMAVEMLNRRIQEKNEEVQTITLPVRLREGNSVASPS